MIREQNLFVKSTRSWKWILFPDIIQSPTHICLMQNMHKASRRLCVVSERLFGNYICSKTNQSTMTKDMKVNLNWHKT